uniref:Uncharacterized protein n=1 Tax=Ditylenchus dipsaci TaxID=166011 RepID=A0A915DTD9_9BILA
MKRASNHIHSANGSNKKRSHTAPKLNSTSVQQQPDQGPMAPKPYDDGLFIEPAGEDNVQYGDYNST